MEVSPTCVEERSSQADWGHRLDIEEFTQKLENYALKHAIKEHGDHRSEKLRGQIALNEEILKKIPLVLSKPDGIELGGVTNAGRQGIKYTKSIEGNIYIIVEVRTKRKELIPLSIY
jgi:hypothetical protein